MKFEVLKKMIIVGVLGLTSTAFARHGIEITDAVYGYGNRICDATSILNSYCEGRQACTFPVGNELCGDPARGKHKILTVYFRCGWDRGKATGYEHNGPLHISCDDIYRGGHGGHGGRGFNDNNDVQGNLELESSN